MTVAADDDHMTLDELRDAVGRRPDDRVLCLRLGRRLVAQGERAQARAVLEPLEASSPAAAADPITIETTLLLARLDVEEGAREQAMRRYEFILADDIDHAEAWAALQRLRTFRAPAAPRGAALLPGATLVSPAGVSTARYALEQEIGRGATSTVYLARDRLLDLPVALKVLNPELGAAIHARSRERFFWEARAAARLRHPGVVAIYDLDERARTLAMEYLPAGTLHARMISARERRAYCDPAHGNDPGTLTGQEILNTVAHLLCILEHVHASGLIHGDLKPRNLLLRRPGVPVLCDFGVARLLAHNGCSTDGPAGTPLFLAPEQLCGEPASVATDLFAVGAILWEMAAGRPMRTQADLVQRRMSEQPLPADAEARLAARPDTARLIDLCRALTQPEPSHRPHSAAAALQILRWTRGFSTME